jgi:hypothetical protein
MLSFHEFFCKFAEIFARICTTGFYGTGGKLATGTAGVVDTGGK